MHNNFANRRMGRFEIKSGDRSGNQTVVNILGKVTLRNPVETLTEGQKTCLRLVASGMTSKEIALRTGLTPQTVDTYLKSAMARLGASSRREAARMLSSAEASQSLGSPSANVALSSGPGQQVVAADGSGIRWFNPPPVGGRSNELTAAERTFAILKVAAISAATVSALALLIAGLLKTFR